MVVEEFPNILSWLLDQGAIITFLYILGFGVVAGLIAGFVVSSFRNGPSEAFYAISKTVFQAGPDLLGMSPRRIWAIAILAMKENRRLFIVTLVLFVGTLGIAGWFLGGATHQPERSYVAFIFFSAQILVSVFGVLVSAFSLPNDINSKTIFTVVTKPVRSSEIVLGRFIGFSALGTVLLVIIGGLSLVFMHRGLAHQHQFGGAENSGVSESFSVDQWQPITDGLTADGRRAFHPFAIYEAEMLTSLDNGHQHRVAIIQVPDESGEANSQVILEETSGHTHSIEVVESDPESGLPTKLELGPAEGNLRARRPLYASGRGDLAPLSFTDDTGAPSQKGVNIGEMWDYQQYIQGGTEASAIFRFSDINESDFSDTDAINLDLAVAVYRTHKGDIKKRVLAEIEIRNVVDAAETETAVEKSFRIPFETEEFKVQTLTIPRKITEGVVKTADGQTEKRELDFFDDLATNGQVDVILRCTDRQQYLGVARAAIYFHAGDSSFDWNYVKGFIAMWGQMLVVIGLTVALSTFLKGPVVMMGTVGILICGFSQKFIKLVTSSVLGDDPLQDIWGGGPLEALYRLLTQMNLSQPLPDGAGFRIIEYVDRNVLLRALDSITYAIPNMNHFNLADYLAYGYVIDNQLLGQNLIVAATFSISMIVFGYFCFKTREIAAAS